MLVKTLFPSECMCATRLLIITTRALAPGGLVIIETEHPEALFSGTFMDAYGAESRMDAWEVTPDEGPLAGWKLQIAWGSEDDMFDPVQQV